MTPATSRPFQKPPSRRLLGGALPQLLILTIANGFVDGKVKAA